MTQHGQRIAFVTFAAMAAAHSAQPMRVAAQSAPPVIRVGPNVQVSSGRARDTHYEVVLAAHPTDPKRLIAGSLVYPDSTATAGTIVYTSSDGGASWRPTVEGPRLDRTGDPAAAYGPDGTAYYVASVIPRSGDRQLLLFRAPDGGERWEGPFPLTYMDRQYITIDATNGPRHGRVYVNGNNRVPRSISDFVVYRSADGGRTFTGPGSRSAFGSVQAIVMGNAVVGSTGSLVGVYAGFPAVGALNFYAGQHPSLYAASSADGGASIGETTRIDQYVAGGDRKGAIAGNANSEPALAIDATSGQFKDRLYVVWPDSRDGHSEIRFAASSDFGRTWTRSQVISDAPGPNATDQFMPEIAVNRDGVVGITWYDRRDHLDNLGWDVRFTASRDGGASFAPSVKVSERGAAFPLGTTRERTPLPARPTEQEQVNAGRDSFRFMGGDTAGLAADASGAFHALWVDNHTGVPQVWTAAITVGRP